MSYSLFVCESSQGIGQMFASVGMSEEAVETYVKVCLFITFIARLMFN